MCEGPCEFLCVCHYIHLWAYVYVCVSDCPCVCVYVCFPPVPHVLEAKLPGYTWAPGWISSVVIDSTAKRHCYSIGCLARRVAVLIAAKWQSGLTLGHLRDSNRSAEKSYLPPCSSGRPVQARKRNSSSVGSAAGNLLMSHWLFHSFAMREDRLKSPPFLHVCNRWKYREVLSHMVNQRQKYRVLSMAVSLAGLILVSLPCLA